MRPRLQAGLVGLFAIGVSLFVFWFYSDPLPSGWQRVYPDFGATIHTFWQHPAESRVILAGGGRQRIGGTYSGGLLRSEDSGRHWQSSSQGLPDDSEVFALAGDSTIVAGTAAHGIFVSHDQGRSWQVPAQQKPGFDWSLVQVRSLTLLPGPPPRIVIATDGQGILVSEDGGLSWQARNDGLPSLNVQSLVVLGEDELVVGLWLEGVYRSRDGGRNWSPLGPHQDQIGVSALHAAGDRLWIGLQSGGLLVALPRGELRRFAERELEGAGIAAIDDRDGLLAIGTDCRGIAFGRLGGRLEFRNQGLDNLLVTAIAFDRTDARRILLGTWSGLYLAKNPPPRPFALALLSLALVLLTAEALRRLRRSTYFKILTAYDLLTDCPSVGTAIEVLWTDVAAIVWRSNMQRLMSGLAERLSRSSDPVAQAIAPLARLTGNFAQASSHLRSRQLGSEERIRGAQVLAEVATLLEHFAEVEPINRTFLHFLAFQERLISRAHSAATLQHLSALADDLELFLEETRDQPSHRAMIDRKAIAVLCKLARLHAQLAGLPPEDRALVLGRTLSEVLMVTQEVKLTRQGHLGGLAALDMARQFLIDALRDQRQRAEIQLQLQTRVLPSRREAMVVVDLTNTGQGHANNLEIQLKDSPEIKIITRSHHLPSLLKQQTARLEFLVEVQRGERIRLSFHLSWDDLEMTGQQAEFADVVELRCGAERAATFRPLRPNPYVVGRPLRESDVFIGRAETFDRIATSLQGASQDNVVVLMGQRRMGKTSVLRQLRGRLGPHYVPVLVDLQGILGRGEGAFLWEIAAAICAGLEALDIAVVEPSFSSFGEDPGRQFRHHFLKPVCQALGERRLLIAFDEFEVLAERIAGGDLPPQILPYFRSLMQHEDRISFLFAGTHRLDQLTGDYWGALFNLAIYLEIGHLQPKEVEELFLRPTRDHFEIDPLALDKAARATGGHPHFCQLVARELVELRNEEVLDYITVQDLNRVARRVVQKGQLHIAYLWEEASLDERLLLLAVDHLLAVEGSATLAAARELIESRQSISAERELALALRILRRKELLAEQHGRLEIRIELLRYWMDQNRSLVDEAWT